MAEDLNTDEVERMAVRLENGYIVLGQLPLAASLLRTLAACAEKAKAKAAKLAEALEPFAAAADAVDLHDFDMVGDLAPQIQDDYPVETVLEYGETIRVCEVGDLRRARAALASFKGGTDAL